MPTLPRGTISFLHHRTFERLRNSNKFYLTILAKNLDSNSISFLSSPTCVTPSKGTLEEIDKSLKSFANITPDELLGELTPLVPGPQLPHLPYYRLNDTERATLNR